MFLDISRKFQKTFAIFARVKRYDKQSRIYWEKFLDISRMLRKTIPMFARVKRNEEDSRIYMEKFLDKSIEVS